MKPLKIFIGYDSRETIAYHVLCHSIMRHASGPVSITPLVQSQLREKGLYTRERGKTESTEFSMTRFLVPALCGYGDYAIFLDCDMLMTGDVYDLLQIAKDDDHRCVWCVQHDYTPKTKLKMDHQVQTMYPRKNWSSVMVFRNKFCERLTPEYVNTASGLDLHRMAWAGTDPENIGHLPKVWNWLCSEYEPNNEAKLYHWTCGGPWFRNYQFTDHADLWFKELDLAFPSLNMPKPKELVEA
jgi:hypothetical protein